MTAMKSGEGEEVEFDEGIYPKGGVEFWMSDVAEMMKQTCRGSIIQVPARSANPPRQPSPVPRLSLLLHAPCSP
jgi:hypothetical protein